MLEDGLKGLKYFGQIKNSVGVALHRLNCINPQRDLLKTGAFLNFLFFLNNLEYDLSNVAFQVWKILLLFLFNKFFERAEFEFFEDFHAMYQLTLNSPVHQQGLITNANENLTTSVGSSKLFHLIQTCFATPFQQGFAVQKSIKAFKNLHKCH